jgi:hypothetical protein
MAQQGNPGVSGISGAFEQPFTTVTGVTVTHNFNAYPVVQVIDNGLAVLISYSVTHTNPNVLVVTFNAITSGYVICTLGGVSTTVVTKNSDYTILSTDNLILVNAACTITLPATAGLQGKTYNIKHITTDGISVIVNTSGGATIDGELSKTMIAKNTNLTVFTDGSQWYII